MRTDGCDETVSAASKRTVLKCQDLLWPFKLKCHDVWNHLIYHLGVHVRLFIMSRVMTSPLGYLELCVARW